MEQNLSQYKIFFEVAKAGNISRAAKELYISQPAISKAIGKLEDSRLSQLLRLYYQCNFTFAEAAEHMGYSERQIMRLHTMALREVQNLLQEGSRCHLAS